MARTILIQVDSDMKPILDEFNSQLDTCQKTESEILQSNNNSYNSIDYFNAKIAFLDSRIRNRFLEIESEKFKAVWDNVFEKYNWEEDALFDMYLEFISLLEICQYVKNKYKSVS